MINFVKFKSMDGYVFLREDIIIAFGTLYEDDYRKMGANSYIAMQDVKDAIIVKETTKEIETILKKHQQRQNKVVSIAYDFTKALTGSVTTSGCGPWTDIPEKPVLIPTVLPGETVPPKQEEQHKTVEPHETTYTTDPNTPLQPGDRWVYLGKILAPMYVQGKVVAIQDQGTTLYRSEPDPNWVGPVEAPSL